MLSSDFMWKVCTWQIFHYYDYYKWVLCLWWSDVESGVPRWPGSRSPTAWRHTSWSTQATSRCSSVSSAPPPVAVRLTSRSTCRSCTTAMSPSRVASVERAFQIGWYLLQVWQNFQFCSFPAFQLCVCVFCSFPAKCSLGTVLYSVQEMCAL